MGENKSSDRVTGNFSPKPIKARRKEQNFQMLKEKKKNNKLPLQSSIPSKSILKEWRENQDILNEKE